MPLASVNSTYTDIVTSVFSSAIAGKVWFASAAVFFALVQIVDRLADLREAPLGAPAARSSASRSARSTAGRAGSRSSARSRSRSTASSSSASRATTPGCSIHSLLGSFFYGVFAVKVLVVRDHSLPGWALPLAGGTLFTFLVALWSTSSFWYFTTIRFGF